MNRSLMAKLKYEQCLVPGTVSADTNCSSVDTKDFNALAFLVNVGAFAFDGSNKIDIAVEHSDDDVTFVAADATDIYQPESGNIAKSLDAAGDASKVHAVHYLGYKRYVRIVLDETGTVTAPIGVVAVEGANEFMPPL